MHRITRQIRNDHKRMKRLLDLLEHEAATLATGDDHDYGTIIDIVDYFTRYPDRYHHQLEDALFGWLSEIRPEAESVIQQITTDHATQSIHCSELESLLQGVRAGHLVPRAQVVQRLQHFVDEQRRHIDNEETEILVLLDQTLARRSPPKLPQPEEENSSSICSDVARNIEQQVQATTDIHDQKLANA